jgi:hypothetical protein
LKPESVQVGDFIYCRSKHYRSQLQLPEDVGLVIEIKRSNFKILYPNDKRCWLPREAFVKVRPEPDYKTFLGKLHYIIKKVRALECEIVSDNGLCRLALRIDRMDLETMDDLRNFLSESLVSLAVVPEGMAFMQTEISFRAEE